jgi:hydroxymethylpyrimidine pyrophosphatase-like HAD family hydrolase
LISNIRAVFADLGGTLLDEHGNFYTVHGEDLNLSVIASLAERGVSFGIVTGLPPRALAKRFTGTSKKYLELIAYAVLENGTAIYRSGGSTLSFSSDQLDQTWAAKFAHARFDLEAIAQRLSKAELEFQRFDYSVRLDIKDNGLSESRLRDLLAWQTERVTTRVSRGQLIFCPANTNKGAAIRFIAENEGWQLTDVMAIGNDDGDASFLKLVGHLRAPANATESLKKLILDEGGLISEHTYGRAVYEFLSLVS